MAEPSYAARRAAERELALRRAREAIDRCNFNLFFPVIDLVGPDGAIAVHARDKYPKHLEFFAAGVTYPQRLFMAANRVGKSESGAFEVTAHVTGQYPDWWRGRRFDEPGEWWVCGTTAETTRDIVQAKLFGPPNPNGDILPGGMIPPNLIVHRQKRPHGLPGAFEQVWIRHRTGKHSVIAFKTYEQGRKSFEGTSKQGIWCDEEPPLDVWTEMLLRLVTTKGIAIVTFTPLQGMSDVVKGFVQPDNPAALQFKHVTMAGWDDVPHLDETSKAIYLATIPKYQLDARTKGIPMLGAGAIYGFPESELAVSPFKIPDSWRRCFGLDAGGGAKPTAAVWLAIDPVSNVVYLNDVYKRESPEVALHIAAVKARGAWIPGVGDAAALLLTEHDAEQLISIYQRAGIDIELPDKAVETGIQEVWELMSAGLFKVFSSATAWWDEWRMYHRDEKGRIVKKNDHALDATRYGVRSGRARARTEADWQRSQRPHEAEPGTMSLGWMS